MGQMVICQLDDAALAPLKRRAKERGVSAEALAREAIHKAAELSVAEKQALVRAMQAKFRAALVPGATPTPGVELIREDRDFGHRRQRRVQMAGSGRA